MVEYVSYYQEDDFFVIELIDMVLILDLMNKLCYYYFKIIVFSWVNKVVDQSDLVVFVQDLENKDLLVLLSDFYYQVIGEELSDNQCQWVKDVLLVV